MNSVVDRLAVEQGFEKGLKGHKSCFSCQTELLCAAGDKYPAGVKSCEDIQEWGAKACPTDAKYTYCISGNAHNGCRHIEDGPFPKVDCTKSCISHNYL